MSKSDLESYLAYYRQISAPGFAMLVTGAWGSGKTHQVRRILGDDAYYVSLFGLSSAEAVRDAVLFAVDPGLKKTEKALRKTGQFAFLLGKTAATGADLAQGYWRNRMRNQIEDRLREEAGKLLVFDDLERCPLELREIQGIINDYVEHQGRGVVVIAHDEKIVGSFADTKEKLVGQTIRVVPETEAAFEAFLDRLNEETAAGIIRRNRAAILEIMRSSGTASLRVLRYAILALDRLLRGLDGKYLANPAAMDELVLTVADADFWQRKDQEAKTDSGVRRRRDEPDDKKKASLAAEAVRRNPRLDEDHLKHRRVRPLLSEGLLRRFLIDGNLDKAEIQAELDLSRFFAGEDYPAWRNLINYWDINEATLAKETARFERDFAARKVTWPLELIHVFAMKLHLSVDAGEAGLDTAERECMAYIDDLARHPSSPPWDPYSAEYSGGIMHGLGGASGYGGHRYFAPEEAGDRFKTLRRRLGEVQHAALAAAIDRDLQRAIDQLSSDPGAFVSVFTGRRASGEIWEPDALNRYPVLTSVSPADFVQAVRRAPPTHWWAVRLMFFSRYGRGAFPDHFDAEKDWIADVVSRFDGNAGHFTGLTRVQWREIVPDEVRRRLASG